MPVRTVTLQADLATIPNTVYIGPRTVVALPPNSLEFAGYGSYAEGYDLTGVAPDTLTVYINGVRYARAYDPTMES